MYILFDIGGTKMRVARSEDGKTIAPDIYIVSTPKLWKDAEPILRDLFGKNKGVAAVCGGMPGIFDKDKGELAWSPNLPDWVGKPIKALVEESSGAKAVFYNDAIMSGVGEAVSGAGQGHSIVAFLTISTGVGGSRIVNGRQDEHYRGFEPGQQITDFKTGTTLEGLISGSSFHRRFGDNFIHEAPDTAWRDAARALAAGVRNTIAYWSPEVVILGGPMILKKPGIDFDVVNEELSKMMTVFPFPVPVKSAKLADQCGLYGALAMLS